MVSRINHLQPCVVEMCVVESGKRCVAEAATLCGEGGRGCLLPVGEAEDCPLRPVGKGSAAVLARAGEEDLVARRRCKGCKGCKGAAVRRCGGAGVRQWCGTIAPIEAIASTL